MNTYDRQHLLAEQGFLREQLVGLPPSARLTRMSTESRLRTIETQLAEIPVDEREPARARLTFNGAPVIGSHGIFADFGMRAVSSFTDAVASIAASLAAPLASMGPIPNRDQNQLLITNTAVGSFGFELEEFRGAQLLLEDESAMAVALDRTQALLQGTLGNDEDLADVASETDPRALEKIRTFLRVLADSDAVCALQYRGRGVRFTDVGQVRASLERLGADNLRESEQQLHGEFVGVLPKSRTFEFKLAGEEKIIRAKVATTIQNVDELNQHLHQTVAIHVMTTQVGNGRPRYLLMRMPAWAA
jgi:hypothetical protein